MRPFIRTITTFTIAALIAAGVALTPSVASATPPPDFATTQADCDSGSVSTTWPMTGITTRPTVTAVTIDGESISPSRISVPQDGEIGVAICAQDPDFAKNSGLSFYKRINSMNQSSNLTGAVTPLGHAITASSQIEVTVAMGDLSPYFSFTTVFGKVNAWATTGIHSSAATLTFNVSPVNGVMVDGMDDFGNPSMAEQGCTQQPPNCSPVKADADTFGVYMQFKAERGPNTGFNSFAGGYFALQSAVGGFVAPRDGGLEVTIAGPHYKTDGTTLNVGSMSAYLPESFLTQAFGLTAADVTSSTFAVTRTEDAGTAAAPWTYRVVPGGIAVDVASITFSSPKYRIAKASASTNTAPTMWPAPPFFSVSKKSRTVTARFAAAPGGQYVISYTNLFSTSHRAIVSTSKSWKARSAIRTLPRGTWLVIARQRIGSGFSAPAFKVITV